ncbi:MAG TPA: phytoene/squalene synthase family protein [Steroidobacteraceae bacterium]|nr:phytoene/squalene synthase family protein [Steroidobacteraceae bacterium]
MSRAVSNIESSISDLDFQDRILPHVSRTFALTIPLLPGRLRCAVSNAYLSCRIADTIEDELPLASDDTLAYLRQFADALAGRRDPERLGREIAARLPEGTLQGERQLVRNMARVVRVTCALDDRAREAIRHCVDVMCEGMHRFQCRTSLRGLDRMSDLDTYCYYVAGVVGEMLTELFCGYSSEIDVHQAELSALARSFGQGLQMTNILKDQWEDRQRGVCWLPRDVFGSHGVELARLRPGRADNRFCAALDELIGIAHGYLRDALAFTLLIPPEEKGIRGFCLWAIGLAVLTLRRIHENPWFASGADVKVSHGEVFLVRALTRMAGRNDAMLVRLFETAAEGLPLVRSDRSGSAALTGESGVLHLDDWL